MGKKIDDTIMTIEEIASYLYIISKNETNKALN